MTAAAINPSSSPPRRATPGFPEMSSAATSPPPGFRLDAPSAAAVVPEPASDLAPMNTAGRLVSAAGWRSMGRSIADVSNPRRAATLAAAASSAIDGSSGRTMRASTASIAPSSFVSRKTAPGLKKSESDGAEAGESVRPNATAQKKNSEKRVAALNSELIPQGQLELARRRIDVGEKLVHLAE